MRVSASATYLVPAIGRGFNNTGFADPVVEYRFAEGHYDRLHDLAQELLNQNVSVIIADGVSATIASNKATEKIPIVLMIGADPITLGLVGSLSRPGANLTGLVMFGIELIGKRLEILRELVPREARVALLVNPKSPNVALVIKEARAAAEAMDQEMYVIEAGSESELDAAFASLRQRQIAAVLVPADTALVRFDEAIQMLAPIGLFPIPKVLRGFHENKRYPDAYTELDKERFRKYASHARTHYKPMLARMTERPSLDMFKDDELLDGEPSFFGQSCQAGHLFVRINPDGEVFRCGASNTFGNILSGTFARHTGPAPCNTSHCVYFCQKYTQSGSTLALA